MKRGDIVIVRERGTMASKARPCLVVQANGFLPARIRVSLCPITTTLLAAPLFRVPIFAGDRTGLRRASEIEIDLVSNYDVDKIAGHIGRAPSTVMTQVDIALRRWFDL